MPPKESDALLHGNNDYSKQFSMDDEVDDGSSRTRRTNSLGGGGSVLNNLVAKFKSNGCQVLTAVVVGALVGVAIVGKPNTQRNSHRRPWLRSDFHDMGKNLTGPYQLVERQVGHEFFDYYDFRDGPDSISSAGYQTYVGRKRAEEIGIMNVTKTDQPDGHGYQEFVYMSSTPGVGPRDEHGSRLREAVRLEGKRRFHRGLFILDVEHMPAGEGVWPAFWTTDEESWPNNGEIDIVEGINNQDVVKTALHTSEDCDMYAHVPRYAWSGEWDSATGIPDTFTGELNYNNKVEADNCWVMAPHQWANQGCVAVSQENGTIGAAMNDIGGGVYVLEWDPTAGYIRSWVFKNGKVPKNLQQSITSVQRGDEEAVPDPSTWEVAPYAYFAIGDGSGCSSDHFRNHRLVINLAFCGTVAGNRFARDSPALYDQWNVKNDSVATCNAYIDSDPKELEEAYWKIRGVYVYERS
eukprot:CAMPEP_0113514240 /NCGR_PEP_ID=MMETSP0014_2-20120614/40296_1 /TAXON_ID=2857 /ORGANISM="Nitzschia sp." /LENGTH=464 /DNA_ID=CAMNT_0000410709 /DNA_START=192 /DNA_END=1586 /DNA_ORIENTATION=- /assembly_acc=CAM_ASM_000159